MLFSDLESVKNVQEQSNHRVVTLTDPQEDAQHGDLREKRKPHKRIPKLRKTDGLLDALFPAIRHQLLGYLLARPEKWTYLSELAQNLGTTPSSLQRELCTLTAAQILERSKRHARVYFRARRRSPIYQPLCALFSKSSDGDAQWKTNAEVLATASRQVPDHQQRRTKRRPRRSFPYDTVAQMWMKGWTLPKIAQATGYIDINNRHGDLYHSLRNFLRRMHKGYKDETGRIRCLPYRVEARTIRRATKAGEKAISKGRR
jgi:hypothetical protein